MLRVATRRVARAVAAAAALPATRATAEAVAVPARWMSEDTHDDFKPKVKVELGDDEAVQGTIKKVRRAMRCSPPPALQLVEDHPIFLFMKGTPQQPQCGFSQQVVRILHQHGVNFSSVNVLEHPEIRQGVKDFSDWPTIPQLYVNGEFVGGCDILTTMHNDGELGAVLAEAAPPAAERA
ncbi:GRXS11 [Symbiodinium sp. KB8]|nr:GRXS11 [Symbiodinium sp. KB8]